MYKVQFTEDLYNIHLTKTFSGDDNGLHCGLPTPEAGQVVVRGPETEDILTVRDMDKNQWDAFLKSGELEEANKLAAKMIQKAEDDAKFAEHKAAEMEAEKAEFLSKRKKSK